MRYYVNRWLIDDLIIVDAEKRPFIVRRKRQDGNFLEDRLSVKPITKKRVNEFVERLQRGLKADEYRVDEPLYFLMSDKQFAECRFLVSLDKILSPSRTQGNSLEEVLGLKYPIYKNQEKLIMNEIKKEFLIKEQQYQKEHGQLEEQRLRRLKEKERAERSIERVNKKMAQLSPPSWIENLVVPLAEHFKEELGLEYDIYGPFGLRCQLTIYWLADTNKSIIEQPTQSISLIPLDLRTGELGYETGELLEDRNYPSDSIGKLNGMDKEVLPLPDSFEEIKKLIRERD